MKLVQNTGKHLVITMLATAAAFAMSNIINLTLTPYITKVLGAEAYGFVSLAKTFESYAMIAAIAINSYASRFIVVEYHKNNHFRASEYYQTTLISNVILSGVMFLGMMFFVANISFVLSVPDYILHDVQILFLLIFVNFTFINLASSFSAAGYIANRLDLTGYCKTMGYVIEAVALLFLYRFRSPSVIYVGIALCMQSAFILITNLGMTWKLTPELKLIPLNFSKKAANKLVLNGIWNSLNSLGNTLNTGLDLIVCNLMLNDLRMGQLGIAKTMNSLFVSLYQLAAQPFQPLFLKTYTEGNKEKLLAEFKFSMKISGFLSNTAFAGFVSLGVLYYSLWMPDQDASLLYKLTIIGCFSGIFEGSVYPLYYIYTLKIRNKIPCMITIAGGILNVIGMYFLIRYTNLEVYAVVLTTAIIMSFISLVTNPLYMAHCLEVKWNCFYPAIVRNTISCGGMVVVFLVIGKIFQPKGWISLILMAVFMAIVGVVVHYSISFDKAEKRRLFSNLQIQRLGKE